jgi:hypothetical protein
MTLVLLKATLVLTLYLAPSLLTVVAAVVEGVALAGQGATVDLVVAAVLILALEEQQLLGKEITEELGRV